MGTLYNIFGDLDGLTIAVNQRTLQVLGESLSVAARSSSGQALADRLLALARAYKDFAFRHTPRWRAVFEHRLPAARDMPDSFIQQRQSLFALIEDCLEGSPGSPQGADLGTAEVARALLAATHGIVSLALDNKLGGQTSEDADRQIQFIVAAIARGLGASFQ